jgi:hypothetical protein
MTVWAAFEAWVRIYSKIFVAVAPNLPPAVVDALLETRAVVDDSGKVKDKRDSKPVLTRYWLLLKYGCNLQCDRQSVAWQAANRMRTVRNSLVHYDVPEAPSLTASEVWNHMETILLLFIEPSTKLGRTLFYSQFDLYSTLAGLLPLIYEFKERPFHKGWPKKAKIFYCPFYAPDATRYPPRYSAGKTKRAPQQ